ncbi:MAG: hypothetical protein SGBAC_005513 [Bacillariaceae sp.]
MPSSSNKSKDEIICSLTLNDERLSSQSTQEEISPPSESPKHTLISSESAFIASPLENTDEERCDTIAPCERLERTSSQDDLSQQRKASSFSPQADVVYLEQLLLGSNKVLAQHKEQSQRVLALKAKLVQQQKHSEARLQEKEESIKVLNLDLGKANTKSGALQKERDDLETAKQEQAETIEVLQHDVQLAAEMLKQERQEHDILEESQADTIAKLMEEKRSLKQSLTKCRQQLHLRETANTLSEDQYKGVRVELKDTRGINKELAQELENQKQLAESRLEDSRQLEKALYAAKNDAKQCRQQLRCHEKEMAGLQSNLKETEVKLKDTQCSKKQLVEELESQRVLAAERLEVEHEDHQFKVQVHLKARVELQEELQVVAKFLREKELSISILQHNIQLAEKCLEQQCREHKDQNDSQTSTIAKLLKEKCCAEESLSTTHDEAIECQKQLHLREKEMATLQMQLKSVQVELKDSQDTKKQLVDELESLNDFGSKRSEDIRQLDKALSSAKTDATESHHQVTQLENQMTRLHHELKKVRVELIETQDTKEKLSEELESQRVVAEKYLEEKRGLGKALAAAKTEATECHRQVTLLENQMLGLHQELETVQVELQGTQDTKKQVVEELESQRALVAGRLEEKCALSEALSAAKTEAAEFQHELTLREKEMIGLHHQLIKVQVVLRDTQSAKDELVEELESQKVLAAQRLEENSELDIALSDAKTDVNQCHKQVTLLENQMIRLHHKLTNVQVVLKDTQSTKNQVVEELESQKALAAQRLKEEHKLHQSKEAAHLKARIACQQELQVLVKFNQEKEDAVSILQHKVQLAEERLGQQCQEHKAQNESQTKTIGNLLSAKRSVEESLSTTRDDYFECQKQLQLCETEREAVQQQCKEVQVETRDMMSALRCELHKERQRHQTEVKALIDRRNTLEKDIQVLRKNKLKQLQQGAILAESQASVVAKLEAEKFALEEALLSSRRSLATTQHQLQSLGAEVAETQRQKRVEKEKNESQRCLNEKTQGSKRGAAPARQKRVNASSIIEKEHDDSEIQSISRKRARSIHDSAFGSEVSSNEILFTKARNPEVCAQRDIDPKTIRERRQQNRRKLQNEFHCLKNENDILADKERASSVTISKLSKENQRLLQKCAEYRASNQPLKPEKAESQEQHETCQAEVARLQEVVDTLERKKKSLIRKLKDTRADRASLRRYALASDQSFADNSNRHQVDMSCLQNKNKTLEAKIKSTSASVSTLARENEALLQKFKDEHIAKDALQREKDAFQEKYQGREIIITIMRKQIEVHKEQKKTLKDQLEKATNTVASLHQSVRQKVVLLEKLKAKNDAKLHQLQSQSLKSLLVIENSNKELKRSVSSMEGLIAEDAQCIEGLFEERGELQCKILKQNEHSYKSEVDDELQSSLQRHRSTLTKVEEQLGTNSPTKEGKNQQLIRENAELQQLVAETKKQHSAEVESLRAEIEQLKYYAVELGFL